MPALKHGEVEERQAMENATTTGEDEATITVDQIVELLNSPRRRNVLACMESREEMEVEWSKLVLRVTEAECGMDWTEQERKRVQISLYQNHVPKLVAAGAVTQRETEEGTRYVGEGPHFDVVVRAEEALHEAATNPGGEGGLLGRFF